MVSSFDLEAGQVSMIYWSLMHILTFFLNIFTTLSVTNHNKDREIIILRQQVRILQRKVKSPPRISDPERIISAILTDRISQSTKDAPRGLHQVRLIFKPDTLIRWHRELVHRKWMFERKAKPGRPRISSELAALIPRLAKENLRRWGNLVDLAGYNPANSSVRWIICWRNREYCRFFTSTT